MIDSEESLISEMLLLHSKRSESLAERDKETVTRKCGKCYYRIAQKIEFY